MEMINDEFGVGQQRRGDRGPVRRWPGPAIAALIARS